MQLASLCMQESDSTLPDVNKSEKVKSNTVPDSCHNFDAKEK